MKRFLVILNFAFCILTVSFAQISWPEGQLLPSFPASASTQDLIYLNNNNSDAELYLFSSLKGLVNRRQPRIFSYEGDALAEGAYTWLNSLGVKYNETDGWTVLSKYKSEVSGLIVYDPDQLHTVNLAASMAKNLNALVASPTLLSRLTAAPFNFPILRDLRGRFTSKLQIYQMMFDSLWQNMDKRLLVGLDPIFHKASLREYVSALGIAVVWLDPKVSEESALLNKFLASMPAGANYIGWWPEEEPGVTRVSNYGFTTIASDYCSNLTFHSGMPRDIDPHPMPAKPALKNKIYVAFILSDGDNLQYVEHLMRKVWNNPDRGSVPMGWTLSPSMVDAMPGALNYYHQSATDNDNLISGPSGYGYTYPNNWNPAALANFVKKTEEYNVKAGIRVITVWNTITGGINGSVGNIYANNAPTLLGVTAQNTGGALVIYNQLLPGKPLSCNYCNGEQAMIDHIASAASGWSGRTPRFIIIQAAPWNNITPTSFKNVANTLDTNYVVVRPDHIFQLIREANGLTVNPGGIEGNGDGLTGTYFNGKNFEEQVVTRTDTTVNFNWGANAPVAEITNPDNFSVRWTGKVMPRYSGIYTFYLTSDFGSRLWVNDQLIIDNWVGNIATATGKISLIGGEKSEIKVEFFDNRNTASCKLEWASAFQSREIIPKSQLFRADPNGIDQVNSSSEIKIYPVTSATRGIVNIEITNFTDNDECNIQVYNICGKLLFNQKSLQARQQLDLSSYSKGIYLISVKTKQSLTTCKYIID